MTRALVPLGWRLGGLDEVLHGMDKVVARILGDGADKPASWSPRMDFSETDTHYEVTLDLPGLRPEAVEIELHDGALWITGERVEESKEEGRTWHRVERPGGSFRRAVQLGDDVEADGVEAEFVDGVLRVTAPKSERARKRRIEIKQ